MALDDADIKAVELDAQKALLEQVSIHTRSFWHFL